VIRKHTDGVHWLEFELLADFPLLKHGVILRHGGQSSGDHASLNLSQNVGDLPGNVEANLKKVAAVLCLPSIVSVKQCHGTAITMITPQMMTASLSCDGLMTCHPNIGLLISQADCQAAIFYDPIQQSLATVHCGWRGSVQNIYSRAIQMMKSVYHSKPEDLFVCLSPSLGPENAEFVNYKQELPQSFWEYQVRPNYFDFWAISERQFLQAGILPHHIQIARIDNYANEDDYFSFRRSQRGGGRHGTVAALKPNLSPTSRFNKPALGYSLKISAKSRLCLRF
jgi:polyphenol oxidase